MVETDALCPQQSKKWCAPALRMEKHRFFRMAFVFTGHDDSLGAAGGEHPEGCLPRSGLGLVVGGRDTPRTRAAAANAATRRRPSFVHSGRGRRLPLDCGVQSSALP